MAYWRQGESGQQGTWSLESQNSEVRPPETIHASVVDRNVLCEIGIPLNPRTRTVIWLKYNSPPRLPDLESRLIADSVLVPFDFGKYGLNSVPKRYRLTKLVAAACAFTLP